MLQENDIDYDYSDDEVSEYGFGPEVGQLAPMFEELTTYQQGEFKTASLSDYVGQWLVLFFYPRDFTFICRAPRSFQGFEL
jgi:alkyl hydroperoxide reductase subunit AhpC